MSPTWQTACDGQTPDPNDRDPAGDDEARYVRFASCGKNWTARRLRSWLSIARSTDLITAQSKLEELNRTLERRVVERTSRLPRRGASRTWSSLGDLERHIAMLSEEAWRVLRLQP